MKAIFFDFPCLHRAGLLGILGTGDAAPFSAVN